MKHEQGLRFSTLYSRREELLRDLCKELNVTVNACLEVTKVGGDGHLGEALDRLRGMHGKIFDVSLYFDDAFCERWHVALSNAESTLVRWQMFQQSLQDGTETVDARRHRIATFDEYLAALKVLRRDLVNQCRKLIGVSVAD